MLNNRSPLTTAPEHLGSSLPTAGTRCSQPAPHPNPRCRAKCLKPGHSAAAWRMEMNGAAPQAGRHGARDRLPFLPRWTPDSPSFTSLGTLLPHLQRSVCPACSPLSHPTSAHAATVTVPELPHLRSTVYPLTSVLPSGPNLLCGLDHTEEDTSVTGPSCPAPSCALRRRSHQIPHLHLTLWVPSSARSTQALHRRQPHPTTPRSQAPPARNLHIQQSGRALLQTSHE